MILSQLGYDNRLTAFGFYRAVLGEDAHPTGTCKILEESGLETERSWEDAGVAWDSRYWKLNLRGLAEGNYRIRYGTTDGSERITESFAMEPCRFFRGAWQRFHYELCIRFLENKLPHGGFMDCGSPLRELSSHSETGQVLARCLRSALMEPQMKEAFLKHLLEINQYIRNCRVEPGKYSHEAKGGTGYLHELCMSMQTLHDTAYAGLLHMDCWELLGNPEDWEDAVACLERLIRDFPEAKRSRIFPQDKFEERRRFEPWQMYETPVTEPLPGEYRLPVLLRALHLGWKIHKHRPSDTLYSWLKDLLQIIEAAQIRSGEFRGDFLAWPGHPHRLKMFEDSWVEYFKGCVHGHYLGGLTAIAETVSPLQQSANRILQVYIDDWFLPLSESNPFGLPANGIFRDGRPRWFAGIRHGMNGTYGLLLADLLRAARALGRKDLLLPAGKIALWFAGVNPGLRANPALPWQGVCAHYGRGGHFAGCWTGIPNAVSNGFSCGPQFVVPPIGDPTDDRPSHWHDEDWILHGAAVVDLLTELELEL